MNDDAIKLLQEAGCKFFPVKADKTPVGKWKESTAGHPPESDAYGVNLGPNVVVLDFDGKGAKPLYTELWKRFGRGSPPLVVRTPNGMHTYWLCEAELPQKQVSGDGLDTRVAGKGYVLGPGSRGVVKKAKSGVTVYEDGEYNAVRVPDALPTLPKDGVDWVLDALEGGPRREGNPQPGSWDAWRAALPELEPNAGGSQLEGPCPVCDGDDRFRVQKDGAFFCRQCCDGGDAKWAEGVLAKVFDANGAKRPEGRMKPKSEAKPRLRSVAGRKSKATRWLWDGWLPRGQVTLLGGQSGAGKGTFMAQMAKSVITGKWLSGPDSEPGKVVIHSDEDRWETVLRPRLEATGLTEAQIDEGVLELDGRLVDFAALGAEIAAAGDVRCLLLDDIAEGLPESRAGNASNSDIAVRRYLKGMVDLSREADIAVLGVRHLKKYSKDFGGDLKQLVNGSVQWVAVPRVAWMLAENRYSGEGRRAMVMAKCNLGGNEGWAYSGWSFGGRSAVVVGEDEGLEIKAAVAEDFKPDERHWEEILLEAQSGRESGDDGRKSRADGEECRGAVLWELDEGALPEHEIVERAKPHSRTAVQQALETLAANGAVSRRKPTPEERERFPRVRWLYEKASDAGEDNA